MVLILSILKEKPYIFIFLKWKKKYIILRSFKSSENIQKKEKEGGPDSTVSNNQFSSETLNELTMNARERAYYNSNFGEAVNPKTNINPKGGQNSTNLFRIYESKPLIFSDFSEYFR